ncbi:MAG: hypothetical protein FWC39_08740 [Bacteroidetes bacterium]|nr:hypothetical protein [Bacteroidota bacterium]
MEKNLTLEISRKLFAISDNTNKTLLFDRRSNNKEVIDDKFLVTVTYENSTTYLYELKNEYKEMVINLSLSEIAQILQLNKNFSLEKDVRIIKWCSLFFAGLTVLSIIIYLIALLIAM